MEKEIFEKLLLKTAFSFMACDGDIDPEEVNLIRQMAAEKNMFGDMNVDIEMKAMNATLNEKGGQFLRDYFTELNEAKLDDSEQLKLIQVSIDTINADNKVEYSEIKFFKIVRDKLSIDNDDILEAMPDIEEFLEQDIISPSYIANLTEDYLGSFAAPAVGSIGDVSSDIEAAKKANKK